MATVTYYERLVARLLQALEEIEAEIPGLTYPHPSTTKLIRGMRTVPRGFVNYMTAVVERRMDVRALGTYDPAVARDAYQFVDAFQQLHARLRRLTRGVGFTIDLRRAEAADAALTTYGILKGMARLRDKGLAQDVRTLRRYMHRSGTARRRKTKAKA